MNLLEIITRYIYVANWKINTIELIFFRDLERKIFWISSLQLRSDIKVRYPQFL